MKVVTVTASAAAMVAGDLAGVAADLAAAELDMDHMDFLLVEHVDILSDLENTRYVHTLDPAPGPAMAVAEDLVVAEDLAAVEDLAATMIGTTEEQRHWKRKR